MYTHACSHFDAEQRLTQDCKSTTLQYKKVIIHIQYAGDFSQMAAFFREDLKGRIIT